VEALTLSRLTLSLSVAALTSILIYCYSQFTHGYQQMWIGGQYHGHANLSPQNGNVTAASYYYAPVSYYYTPDLYYPPRLSWPDRRGPGYPQWHPTAVALALSLSHLTLSLLQLSRSCRTASRWRRLGSWGSACGGGGPRCQVCACAVMTIVACSRPCSCQTASWGPRSVVSTGRTARLISRRNLPYKSFPIKLSRKIFSLMFLGLFCSISSLRKSVNSSSV
jgi:hypothetical protein